MKTLSGRAKRWGAVVLVAFAAWIAWIQPNRRHSVHQAEYVDAGGVRLRALRAGTGDTTLLFLHGYGESLLSWRLVLDRFTSRFRVLAVDLPGFGLSDKPDGPYTTEFMESVLSDLIARSTSGAIVARIERGTHISGMKPSRRVPENPLLATPTKVNSWRVSFTTFPMTVGSPPKRRCQNA